MVATWCKLGVHYFKQNLENGLGLALHVSIISIFFLQLSHQSFSGLFNTPPVYLQHLEKVVRHASTLGDLFTKLIEYLNS